MGLAVEADQSLSLWSVMTQLPLGLDSSRCLEDMFVENELSFGRDTFSTSDSASHSLTLSLSLDLDLALSHSLTLSLSLPSSD